MKPTSIAEILRRIRGLIASEPRRHGYRVAELIAALKPLVNQQLRKEVA